ncbi:DUF4226 domain-containing protein [Mycobacterium sp. 663a-19]|uniref:DUF4226 domain-containing protein n=1 Tax=Mycobacterium sp. 663a-19 TaxID=2986148 RepID=UPI002D1EB2FF|nr:DUF4226 domain-containing protein [Mycobacterium sp. 663a-19]MEB3980842.1 DUF4226 domain-containing protein [Mycobacterium sp. 663a-19]
MSTYDELLTTVKRVRDRTGDPNAWQAGLTPAELTAVVTPTTRAETLDAILLKIRRQHPDLFDARALPGGPLPDRQEGAAAEAIAEAEAALAHQNSASSQLDLQVVSAIMNAHLKTVEGREALTKLQHETEAAVQTRSDLDTPAGARDFQRFLIGKLRDIRSVVANASLDDTSKSALMAAWTALYDASKGAPSASRESGPAPGAATSAPMRGTAGQSADVADPGWDPLLDSLLADDPGLPAGDQSGQGPTSTTPAAPVAPSVPNFGGLPGLGAAPASPAGWGGPGGLPFGGPQERTDPGGMDDGLAGAEDVDAMDHASPEEADKHAEDEQREQDESADKREPQPAGPTPVTLPDGDTVTAASPQLAAAIKAATGGASIADAFHQQGITIPAPGTAVTNPIDALQVAPGDIGMFTDRHALALGHEKALLDGQIQHIATVTGPSFLGWEHPPVAVATAPATDDAPAPTRPAGTSTTA